MQPARAQPGPSHDAQPFALPASTISSLIMSPQTPVVGRFGSDRFQARVALPGYHERLAARFADVPDAGFREFVDCMPASWRLPHLGLIIEFDNPVALALQTDDGALVPGAVAAIARFGPVILRNAYLTVAQRKPQHRAIFPHRNFHVDRGPQQTEIFSVYTRDPFDAEQRFPRESSTLFISHLAIVLQHMKENGITRFHPVDDIAGHFKVFDGQPIETLFDDLILQQPWNAPEGTGEIGMIDNRTVFHASYYKVSFRKGYKIGVRYLP